MVKDDSGLDEGDVGGSGEKMLDYGYIFRLELGFVMVWMWGVRMRRINNGKLMGIIWFLFVMKCIFFKFLLVIRINFNWLIMIKIFIFRKLFMEDFF